MIFWTHGFELEARGFEFVTSGFKLVTRGFELVTRGFELVTGGFEFVTRGFELVTRGFELVTCNSCFTIHVIILFGFSLILPPGMFISYYTIIYFFVKKFFFSNVYILVNTIFERSYFSFGWNRPSIKYVRN